MAAPPHRLSRVLVPGVVQQERLGLGTVRATELTLTLPPTKTLASRATTRTGAFLMLIGSPYPLLPSTR